MITKITAILYLSCFRQTYDDILNSLFDLRFALKINFQYSFSDVMVLRQILTRKLYTVHLGEILGLDLNLYLQALVCYSAACPVNF